MIIRNLPLLCWLLAAGYTVSAQGLTRTDSIPSDAKASAIHLNIEVPAGQMIFKASNHCGLSIAKATSPDSQLHHRQMEQRRPDGHLLRKVVFQAQSTRQYSSSARTNVDSRAFTEQIASISSLSGGEQAYEALYMPDPSVAMDLFLDLGSGGANLDLSGLKLHSVSINSAFSDINIAYQEPNQVKMQEMDIHAAKANLQVHNLENARAELVTIQNDMGETFLSLGDTRLAKTTVYLQSGVGACTLMIGKAQPTQLVLKSGMFSTVNVGEDFTETHKGVYVNKAFQADPKNGTKIICTIDFGSISVQSAP